MSKIHAAYRIGVCGWLETACGKFMHVSSTEGPEVTCKTCLKSLESGMVNKDLNAERDRRALRKLFGFKL